MDGLMEKQIEELDLWVSGIPCVPGEPMSPGPDVSVLGQVVVYHVLW